MRHALLIAMTTAAGLGACALLPDSGYGYGYGAAPQPVPAYGYYDGGYAPAPRSTPSRPTSRRARPS